MIIESIEIKNFRSIRNSSLDIKNLTIITGNNDAGKSNYLKALNLFFNNETEPGKPYKFSQDYTHFVTRSNKTKETVITLNLNLPSTFKKSGQLKWSKTWRVDGYVSTLERRKYEDGTETKSQKKSKIDIWLENIKFRYIPAIKGDDFFRSILRMLHDTLSLSVEDQINKASTIFADELIQTTSGITEELSNRLGLVSKLSMPSDLRNLFEAFEFQTEHLEKTISLNYRGDGIKVRHIPIILKFLAESDNKTRSRGLPIVHTIWGFEEPENNLELNNTFELAKELYEYSSEIQTIVTTHSPAFYGFRLLTDIDNKINISNISQYHIARNNQNYSNAKAIEDINEINDSFGLMPLLAPILVNEYKEKKIVEFEYRNLIEQTSQSKVNVIIVEGESDKLFIEKLFDVFSPILNGKIIDKSLTVYTEKEFGVENVKKKVLAFSNLNKNNKIYIISDKDSAGAELKQFVLDAKERKLIKQTGVKIDYYPPNISIRNILKSGFTYNYELEDLYSDKDWEYFIEQEYLVERDDFLPANVKHLSCDKSMNEMLEKKLGATILNSRCLYKVNKDQKMSIARNFSNKKSHDDIKSEYEFIKPLIEKIEKFYNA